MIKSSPLVYNVSNKVESRYVWMVLCLAFVVRGFILLLNILWDIPPYWQPDPRFSLIMARSDFGSISLPNGFEETYKMTVLEALSHLRGDDRGVLYLFVLANKIFGQVVYLHIQSLHLIIDSLMVLPIMSIARRASSPMGAVVAGITYALFIPEIQIAASPGYNPWLTFSLIIMTWLVLELSQFELDVFQVRFWKLVGMLLVLNIIFNELRSIIILFSLGAAGWLWFVTIIERSSLQTPNWHRKQICVLILVGVLTIIGSSGINALVRGEFSPVRSSFGHQFWSGVGQFANPLGILEDDGVVHAFYERESGQKDSSNTMGIEYNAWLTERAFKFIKNHPGLYASMVARRGLMIIFPNISFGLVADQPSYTRQPEQIALIEIRKNLVATHGWASLTTLSELLRIDPSYIVSLAFRMFLMITLPLGIFFALSLSSSKIFTLLACLPLAYILFSLAPFYVTPVVIASAHSACLAVSVSGWVILYERVKRFFKNETV